MADQVLYSGVACITDLIVKEGLINLDFADVRSVMRDMGKAMMGTGEASGDGRAMAAAEAAIANPLLDEVSMKGARGLLISITGGRDLTLFEVDEAATRIREEVDEDANIILGATFDEEPRGRHPRLGRRHRHRQDGCRDRGCPDPDPPGAGQARRPAAASRGGSGHRHASGCSSDRKLRAAPIRSPTPSVRRNSTQPTSPLVRLSRPTTFR